ncbi:hypothetical protein [Nocardioides sp. InS609-2]|uniref:hypothetical protein n=1 Tax=Nocardioides sp. InS609-2 TaxID=2760705 RepID=UPI0020BD9304|nr:hypothetical protein [Nocardioides sp. InS609-2]
MAIDYTTPAGQVRLLINDTQADQVFGDDEITAYLALESGSVKRAAAQALDTIADDEALTSKAIRTQDLATDGPKTADSLRKRAAALRAQADQVDEDADEGFFQIVDVVGCGGFGPELTERPGWL